MTNLVNFITAGCSFTAGHDIVQAKQDPRVWPDYLLSTLDPKFFYNLAMLAGGNTQIANNLVYILETKPHINPDDTLIGIAFSGLDRIDTMCAVDHPYANKLFSWATDFGFGWITQGSFASSGPPFNGSLQKHMELTQIQTISCLAIIQCLSYLELRGFDYFFMVMDDTIVDDGPAWFKDNVFNKRKNNYVSFGEYQSMHAFVKSQNLLSSDGFHPNIEGHSNIADHVIKFLNLS